MRERDLRRAGYLPNNLPDNVWDDRIGDLARAVRLKVNHAGGRANRAAVCNDVANSTAPDVEHFRAGACSINVRRRPDRDGAAHADSIVGIVRNVVVRTARRVCDCRSPITVHCVPDNRAVIRRAVDQDRGSVAAEAAPGPMILPLIMAPPTSLRRIPVV